MEARDFVPPLLVKVGRRIRNRLREHGAGTFASYEEALRACGGFGYKNETLAAVVSRKTELYRDRLESPDRPHLTTGDLLNLYVLNLTAREQGQPLHVIDFGGACGAHYFMARAHLPQATQLRWAVVETETMARQAQKHAGSELFFCTSVAEAKQKLTYVDVVHTSCALHYVPDLYLSLNELMELDPKFLVLARFGVAETSSEFFIVQESWLHMHGPGPLPPEFHDAKVCYPAFYPSRHKLETVVSRKFRLHSRSIDPSIKVTINDLLITGVSYVWLSMLRSSAQTLTRFTLFVASFSTAFSALVSDIISYPGPA